IFGAAPGCGARLHFRRLVPATRREEKKMNSRNRIFILLAVICAASLAYYFLSTPSSKDLVLIGTVDSNQVIVSPQMQGRLAKLLVDDLIRIHKIGRAHV